LKWISIFDDERRNDLLTPEFQRSLHGHDSAEFLLRAYDVCPKRDFVTQTTCADVLTYLPCDILTKVDIASMAYALEARSPFLDHHVVDLAARMPIEWKLHGRRGKKILVDTFADLLPPRIQTRAKMGFGVPLDHWFRNELRPLLEDVLLSKQALERGLFQSSVVRGLVDEHVRGAWDHSYRLWSLLVLELWQRTFLDGAVPWQEPRRQSRQLVFHTDPSEDTTRTNGAPLLPQSMPSSTANALYKFLEPILNPLLAM
jgi:asparagine synthase (glutamine-hydrolysing)